jgi:hypothetical protein
VDVVTTYSLSEEGVTAALADLDKGGSEDVAIRLQELGVKGERSGNDTSCPLANYLKCVIADVEYALVGREAAYVKGVLRGDLGEGFIQSWDVRFNVGLPDSVSTFIEDFDAGIYPELIETAEAS